MRVDAVQTENFRLLQGGRCEFSPGVNVIAGANAQGKTTLLEAVYMLTGAKSFRTYYDKELIAFEKDEAAVRGIFRPFGPIQRVQFVDAGVAWVFSRRVRRSAVYFVRASDAVTAKKAMNGRDIEGARIRITRLVKDGGEAPAKPVAPTTL